MTHWRTFFRVSEIHWYCVEFCKMQSIANVKNTSLESEHLLVKYRCWHSRARAYVWTLEGGLSRGSFYWFEKSALLLYWLSQLQTSTGQKTKVVRMLCSVFIASEGWERRRSEFLSAARRRRRAGRLSSPSFSSSFRGSASEIRNLQCKKRRPKRIGFCAAPWKTGSRRRSSLRDICATKENQWVWVESGRYMRLSHQTAWHNAFGKTWH